MTCFNSAPPNEKLSPTIQSADTNQSKKEMNPHPIRHLFSARTSQSTALPTTGSYPPYLDPIPTRSRHQCVSNGRFHIRSRKRGRKERRRAYIAVSFFANELVLERCARGQIHRRAPHRVMDWVQRNLRVVVNVRCLQNPHAHVPHWTDPSSRVAARCPRRRCSTTWLIVNLSTVGARN
jgi:hypothetical protein